MYVRTSHGRPSLCEPDHASLHWKTPTVLKTSRHASAVSDKTEVCEPRAASLERYSRLTVRPSSSQLLPSHVRLHETNGHLSDNFIDLTSSSNDNHSHTCTLGLLLTLSLPVTVWIGSCFTGPILLCIDLFVLISVYFVCFCFILHSCCIIVNMVGWT